MAIERRNYPEDVANEIEQMEILSAEDEMSATVELPDDESALDEGIELVDDEGNPIDEEGNLLETESSQPEETYDHYQNLAELVSEETLNGIGRDLQNLIRDDESTTKDWEEIYKDGMDLLGFDFNDNSGEVFQGSCTATHPLLAESIIKYQARARSQLLPPTGPAHVQVIGKWTPEKEQQAQRVKQHLNYQLMHEMTEYNAEHDRMLFSQGFIGDAITKMYYDPDLERNVSRFIPVRNFIINYGATDLESAYRYAEIIPAMDLNEFRKMQLSGFYRRIPDWDPADPTADDLQTEEDDLMGITRPATQDGVTLVEVHTYLEPAPEFDDRSEEEAEIGIELPYIITYERASGKVLSIRRNWREDDPKKRKRVWYAHWPLIPGFGFWGLGYVHIIGGLSKCATSVLRQLIDAGSFANLPAGFKAKGFRTIGSNEPLQPGEWREINSTATDISKVFQPLPYHEPSQTLFALLEFVTQAAQKFADSTEQVVSESTNYGPVGTTLALLDASGKLFTGIHERLFEAQKQELRILSELNYENLPDEYPFEVNGAPEGSSVFRQDYDGRVDIVPVTDPRAPSAAHRVAKANARLSIAAQFPKEHNIREILSDLHFSLDENGDPTRFLNPPPPEAYPTDPLTENQMALMGQPLKSAPYQDHNAHVEVHASLLAPGTEGIDPSVKAAMAAHIHEHYAESFRVMIEQQIGQPLPKSDPKQPMPPEIENQIAQLTAVAVQKLEQEKGISFAALVDDPLIKIQEMEQESKQLKIVADAQSAASKIEFMYAQMQQKWQEHLDQMEKELADLRLTAEQIRDQKELGDRKLDIEEKKATKETPKK